MSRRATSPTRDSASHCSPIWIGRYCFAARSNQPTPRPGEGAHRGDLGGTQPVLADQGGQLADRLITRREHRNQGRRAAVVESLPPHEASSLAGSWLRV